MVEVEPFLQYVLASFERYSGLMVSAFVVKLDVGIPRAESKYNSDWLQNENSVPPR